MSRTACPSQRQRRTRRRRERHYRWHTETLALTGDREPEARGAREQMQASFHFEQQAVRRLEADARRVRFSAQREPLQRRRRHRCGQMHAGP